MTTAVGSPLKTPSPPHIVLHDMTDSINDEANYYVIITYSLQSTSDNFVFPTTIAMFYLI